MWFQSASLQGKRESNEDQHFYFNNLNGNKNGNKIIFFSVFDGHGGKGVSKYLKKNLPKYFINKRIEYNNKLEVSKYILKAYSKIQNNLEKKHPRMSQYSGSTASTCILSKNKNQLNLWVINVGDSRGVLCNKNNVAIQLSQDHKPNVKSERKRIEKLGGKIKFDGYDWRIQDLSLSRAFGDSDSTPYVTHLPQIYKYKISKNDKFIILGCDGVWDVLSNQKAVNYVNKFYSHYNKINIAKKLANYAIEQGSTDNVTVIILFLK